MIFFSLKRCAGTFWEIRYSSKYLAILIVLKSAKRQIRSTALKKWSFQLKISSVNVTEPQFPADLVTFTEETLNGKLHFLCSGVTSFSWWCFPYIVFTTIFLSRKEGHNFLKLMSFQSFFMDSFVLLCYIVRFNAELLKVQNSPYVQRWI